MRRWKLATLSLALGLAGSSLWAQSAPDVIATSKKPAPPQPFGSAPQPVAVIGAPQPVAVTEVIPTSYNVRGQKDEKAAPAAAPPPANTDIGASLLHAPMPSTTPLPLITSTPTTSSGPIVTPTPATVGTVGPVLGPVFLAPIASPLNNRWYVSGEYLYWWIRDGGLPPLVSTGPATDPAPGVLSTPSIAPNSQVLFGNGPINTQGRSGARFEVGRWFGDCRPWAIEGGFFFLGQRSTTFSAGGDGSAGSPVIARPFIESNRGVETVEYVNFPGVLRGNINITSTNNFYGANIDWRRRLWCPPCSNFRVDGQIGFRYLNFDEDLRITENPQLLVPVLNEGGIPLAAGLQQNSTDYFKVRNQFYGAMFGVVSEYYCGRFSLGLSTKVSLGTTRENLEIAGGQTITVPGAPTGSFTGGLLARPTNIGNYTTDKFTVVPEVGFRVGYQATQHFKFFLGYDFLYWSNMLRVGDQVDRTVNLGGVPLFIQPGQTSITTGQVLPAGDPNRPAAILKETDFWAQGISAGVLWTW